MRLQIVKISKRRNKSRRYPRPKSRIYCWFENDSVLDHLVRRRNMPTKLLRQIIPSVFEKLDIDPKMSFRWSQKAGCKCGCSPGFILSDYSEYDIFLTVKFVAEDAKESRLVNAAFLAQERSRGKQVEMTPAFYLSFPKGVQQQQEYPGFQLQ